MFVDVSAYLVKTLGIKQNLTNINYVEELPKIAKKLHYSGNITKSWLKTANAMHSWPNVLSWIGWLVEVCEVKQYALKKFNLNDLPFIGDEKQSAINRNIFFCMLNCYRAWNDEKHDEEAEVIEKYLQKIKDQQGVTDEEIENARHAVEEEARELQAAEEIGNELDEEIMRLKEKLTSLQTTDANLLSVIKTKEEYIEKANIETEQIIVKCNATRQKINSQKLQHAELLSVLEKQTMSAVERDKIIDKCKEIKSYVQQFDGHLQDFEKELYALDMKLSSVNNKLNEAILTYNKEIFLTFGNDIGMDLEELKMPENGISHPNIIETFNAKADLLNDLKEHLTKRFIEKDNVIKSDTKQLERLQEKMKMLEDEYNNANSKLEEKKKIMNKIKTDAKNEETRLREEIKILENDIKQIEESMPDVQGIAAELEESKDKLDALRRKKAFMEESAKLFFTEFYEIIGEHRDKLHSILTKRRR